MPTTTETPEPEPRVRVNSYQARIERTLTDIFYEVPTERQAGREWILTHVAHTNGYAVCELCGHNPIKRLFFIKSNTTGRELMIGSECARNYADVDLIDAYMRRMVQRQNHIRQAARRRDQNEAARRRTEEIVAQRAAQQQEWRTAHPELIEFLRTVEEHAPPSDRFLHSMVQDLRQYGRLTDRQTETTERIRIERAERAMNAPAVSGATQNALDRAARVDDCPNIYNGTYTMTDVATREHMTFQIYTPQRGRLQGTRIVKVMRQYSRYEGFAFVGRDGGLVLWRRYRDHADQPYVQWATRLLERLNTGPSETDSDSLLMGTHPTIWRVERTRSCRRCNRRLTTPTSIHAGIGPECQRQVTQETSAATQRTEDAPFVAEATIHVALTESADRLQRAQAHLSERTRLSERRARASAAASAAGPRLSELGTGEEL